ncbi:hypothetical protein K402DRAFT_103918 [Aulographum hederae CBS 113979]|uniref:Uncharacterized protein n=1 Tax=Aulographum hederae CBS 113979 TaxID=1176131 RepID=A0A6G1GXM5_9PEZI|nr:hypothetical protein K402DRAFT_103918 [Aulographum hederae CBS 113979]
MSENHYLVGTGSRIRSKYSLTVLNWNYQSCSVFGSARRPRSCYSAGFAISGDGASMSLRAAHVMRLERAGTTSRRPILPIRIYFSSLLFFLNFHFTQSSSGQSQQLHISLLNFTSAASSWTALFLPSACTWAESSHIFALPSIIDLQVSKEAYCS